MDKQDCNYIVHLLLKEVTSLRDLNDPKYDQAIERLIRMAHKIHDLAK